jgi:hypothetical protein
MGCQYPRERPPEVAHDWPAMVEKLLGALTLPATPERLRAVVAGLGWDENTGASVLVRAEDDGLIRWDSPAQMWTEPEPPELVF